MEKALFLDRDGVVILDKHYLSDPEEVELIGGVRGFLVKAMGLGYGLFILSNQSGVGRGYFTQEEMEACNGRMLELLDLPEPGFVEMCFATEKPGEEGGYRKPSPRFIDEMVERYGLDRKKSFMVGDKLADMEAGVNGGVRPVWVASGKAKDAELEGYLKEAKVLELKELGELLSYL